MLGLGQMITRKLDLTQYNNDIAITEDSQIIGLFIGKGNDLLKSIITIRHTEPNLKSRIKIKAVVFDQAEFNLELKLIIEKSAFGTDTYLKVDALMIDPTSRARVVPSLEIKTDNVKGGHGATVGRIDQIQIHYLTSRGLSYKQAQDLIIEAFIQDIEQDLA